MELRIALRTLLRVTTVYCHSSRGALALHIQMGYLV
jgi:hypothetical protein